MNHIFESSENRYFGPAGFNAPGWVSDWLEQQPWYEEFYYTVDTVFRTQDLTLGHDVCIVPIQQYLNDHNITMLKIVNGVLWADITVTPEITLMILTSE